MRYVTSLLLFLSMAGYLSWIVTALRIDLFLAPAFLITCITAVMYAAGLLNVMPACAWLILAGGLALPVRLIIRRRNREKTGIRSFGVQGRWLALAVTAGIFGYMFWYWKGALYADGDSMTHWGIIVRVMYENGRLPNFQNVIHYQSYPPAAACWIWFILKFAGYSEAKALMAQGIWSVACGMSVFSLCARKADSPFPHGRKTVPQIICILFFLMVLFSWVYPDTLRVDQLLGLVPMAGMIGLFCFRKSPDRALMWVSPFLVVIPLIKNSGMLFAVFLFLIWIRIARTGRLASKSGYLICLMNLAVPFWLWQAHVGMVYEAAQQTRHSVSAGYMLDIFRSRSPELIREICVNFLHHWLSADTFVSWLVLAFFAAAFLMAVLCVKDKGEKREIRYILIAGICFFLIYQAGVLLMYLFDMPGEDARFLYSITRYEGTILILMLAAVLLLLLYTYQSAQLAGRLAAFAAALAFFLLFAWKQDLPGSFQRPDYAGDGLHRQMAAMIGEEESLHEGQKILAFSKQAFAYMYAQFTFHNLTAHASGNPEYIEETLQTNPDGYEALLILEKNKKIRKILKKYGYDKDTKVILLTH